VIGNSRGPNRALKGSSSYRVFAPAFRLRARNLAHNAGTKVLEFASGLGATAEVHGYPAPANSVEIDPSVWTGRALQATGAISQE
jgi:hypothetical protein